MYAAESMLWTISFPSYMQVLVPVPRMAAKPGWSPKSARAAASRSCPIAIFFRVVHARAVVVHLVDPLERQVVRQALSERADDIVAVHEIGVVALRVEVNLFVRIIQQTPVCFGRPSVCDNNHVDLVLVLRCLHCLDENTLFRFSLQQSKRCFFTKKGNGHADCFPFRKQRRSASWPCPWRPAQPTGRSVR